MPECLEAALRRVGATVSFGPISEVRRFGLKSTADAVVVIPSEDARSGSDGLQELFSQVANHPRATLVLQPEGSDAPRPAHPAALPVSFSTQTSAEELAARIVTMIEMRDSLESLHRVSAAARQADERLALQYRQQLHVASQLQREFLPHALPRCRGISFSAIYCPMDYVSGDIYDVRRLDDEHVAVALVDAQGHGICAALLTVFIKRALREEMGRNGDHRALRPDEMLSRLNRELLEADLTESPFAAAIYALLNVQTRRVELARGGAPYPIRRYANGCSKLLRPAGPLVGVLSNARFAVESFVLAPRE
jgi:sigma-B regulation protein RsbU (phosphoserine phosphatase)